MTPVVASAVELTATSADGTELAGTLHVPESKGPHNTVVFTHGSEPGLRNSNAYRRWADAFVAKGVAALVFDKRGCGESQGTYVEAPDLATPAADLVAWVELLKTRDDVASVGVFGWSQGGWVGPLAASKSDDVTFVVAISGSGVSPLEQNIYDKTNQCAATGVTAEQVSAFEQTIRLVWTYIITGDNREEADKAWAAVADEEWFQNAYNGPPMMDRDRLLQHPRMTQYVAHSTFEPAPVLASLDVPMLAVFGSADTIVPVDASIEAMTQAFETAPGELTVKVITGGDHGLRVGGALADGYPDVVVEWVVETLR
jgi:pimeloyl-ACP methyl ester carboxylesterase